MCLSRSRNSYSVAVSKSEGLYCALGCSIQAVFKASGSPVWMPRGTLGPVRALLLCYQGRTWNDEEGSVNPSSMQCWGVQVCLRWVKVLLQSPGLMHLFIQPWVMCLPEEPTESSVSCSGGHGAASATRLWACSNIPVTFARTQDLCKLKSSFTTAVWPMYSLRPELPWRAALA